MDPILLLAIAGLCVTISAILSNIRLSKLEITVKELKKKIKDLEHGKFNKG